MNKSKAKFEIGQTVYGVSQYQIERTKRQFSILDIFYDSLVDCWMYTDSLEGHWPENWLRDVKDVIFCAECGKEEYPNCGVNISSLGSTSVKLHWECYYNNVNERWRLERVYGDNSKAMVMLSEEERKQLVGDKK